MTLVGTGPIMTDAESGQISPRLIEPSIIGDDSDDKKSAPPRPPPPSSKRPNSLEVEVRQGRLLLIPFVARNYLSYFIHLLIGK